MICDRIFEQYMKGSEHNKHDEHEIFGINSYAIFRSGSVLNT